MKILYLNALYSPYIEGGAEISLQHLVEGMQSIGYEVAVLSMFPGKGMVEEKENGVRVYRAGLKNFYWPYDKDRQEIFTRLAWHLRDRYNSKMALYLRKVIEKEKPDLVSCHNLAGWSISVWDEVLKAKIPLVQVLHDLYLLCPNSNMFKNDSPCRSQCLSCRILRWEHVSKSRKVNAVVGISKSILERFTGAGYFKGSKKFVIHNTRAVPEPFLKKERKKNQAIKIGYLGTLSKIKGIEWLIEQFQFLGADAKLFIGGRGKEEYEQKLKQLALGKNIAFLGYVQSNEFYQKIDVLIVPSLWEEPLGMVAIEALANNLPVIANRIGGLKETVVDGVNGLFCDSESPDSLGMAMLRVQQDENLYNSLASAARESVMPILSKERMLGEYQQVVAHFSKKQPIQ